MRIPRNYLAEIGRRGGIRSRRSLDSETARWMVAKRVARLQAKRVAQSTVRRLGGTPADTTTAAQAIQDALLRRMSASQKVDRAARLSRMVDQLSIEGLRTRHPKADPEMIRHLREELRLGKTLAADVNAARRQRA
jgi:hypothetical protein